MFWAIHQVPPVVLKIDTSVHGCSEDSYCETKAPSGSFSTRPSAIASAVRHCIALAPAPVATRKLPSSSNSGRDVEFFATGSCSALVLLIAQGSFPRCCNKNRIVNSRIVVLLSIRRIKSAATVVSNHFSDLQDLPKTTASGVKTYPINQSPLSLSEQQQQLLSHH